MQRYRLHVLMLVLASSMAAQAMAQGGQGAQGADKAVATVRTDGGVVMVSEQNAAFATAQPNQSVVSGDRLMVSKDSIATVIYNDGCEQKYDKPGIYKIEPNCTRAAALSNGSGWTTGQMALAVAGGAVLGAVVENQSHQSSPVSR